jgi:VCBS repeat-containing protein
MPAPLSTRPLFLLLALVGLALAATGCSPAQRVVGKWELDTTKAFGSSGTPEVQGLGAMITLMQPKVFVTFEGNGNYLISGTFGPQKIDKNGSWRYVKTEGETLVLMVKQAGATDENELRVKFSDLDHAEMSVPMELPGNMQAPAMQFVRVKPAS